MSQVAVFRCQGHRQNPKYHDICGTILGWYDDPPRVVLRCSRCGWLSRVTVDGQVSSVPPEGQDEALGGLFIGSSLGRQVRSGL